MALRAAKTLKASDPIEQAPLAVDQRKQAEQRYRLQVDRQTKRSFDSLEAAAEAGTVIKKAHPIVQVSIYDAIDCVNQLIGLDGLVAAAADKPA
jgi:adenylyl- and sulfurtransferase ThiI